MKTVVGRGVTGFRDPGGGRPEFGAGLGVDVEPPIIGRGSPDACARGPDACARGPDACARGPDACARGVAEQQDTAVVAEPNPVGRDLAVAKSGGMECGEGFGDRGPDTKRVRHVGVRHVGVRGRGGGLSRDESFAQRSPWRDQREHDSPLVRQRGKVDRLERFRRHLRVGLQTLDEFVIEGSLAQHPDVSGFARRGVLRGEPSAQRDRGMLAGADEGAESEPGW